MRKREAHKAPVVAVDDTGRDPGWVRGSASRPGAAAARRRREKPLGGGLAGRHQRHARHDRVQQQGERERFLQDDGGPRADADARDPGRARGAHPRLHVRATTGRCTHGSARRPGNTTGAGSTRSSRRTTDAERRQERLWDATAAEAVVAACAGRDGLVTEETKPSTQLSPLLFDLTSLQREANGRFGFSARGTLSLAQAPVRASQGPDLSADRFAGVAGRLHTHGPEDARAAVGERRLRSVRRGCPQEPVGEAQQAHIRQHQDLGPLRDHPHAADAQTSQRGGAEAVRPRGADGSWRFSTPPPNTCRPHASRP
jgi:hypothetical protein